jgi:hypothetical protein
MIRMFIPDRDLDFYPTWIPDPGVKKAPDPKSATLPRMKENAIVVHCSVVDLKPLNPDPDPDPRWIGPNSTKWCT